jgi:DNA-binding MarR family transcriptional regulator
MKTTQTKKTNTTESSFTLLSQVIDLWQDELKAELSQYKLSYIEFTVLTSLLYLREQRNEVTQVNICTYANIKPMNASIVVRGLQAKGFIKRQEHSIDTRAKAINFTTEGLKTLQTAVTEVEALNVSFFETSQAELLKVTKKLEEIRNTKKQ